jgi:glycosyltransferase involved in cell wall biosynthesis
VELEGELTSVQRREAFRKANKIKKDDVVIFFMGRMLADMGLDVVLDTIPSLIDDFSTVRHVIAGATGDLTHRAIELAQLYPEKVLVLENVSFALQRDLYSAADILVAPSFNQRACMGVSIKEAMAARLPVVGGAGGGVSEAVVDGVTGFLIPIEPSGVVDAKAYLKAVHRLIREPELRLHFGDAGRHRAEDIFSVHQTNKRIAEIMIASKI